MIELIEMVEKHNNLIGGPKEHPPKKVVPRYILVNPVWRWQYLKYTCINNICHDIGT